MDPTLFLFDRFSKTASNSSIDSPPSIYKY